MVLGGSLQGWTLLLNFGSGKIDIKRVALQKLTPSIQNYLCHGGFLLTSISFLEPVSYYKGPDKSGYVAARSIEHSSIKSLPLKQREFYVF